MKHARHRTHKKDANHKDIVEMFQDVCFSVFDTAAVGNGFPDAVAGCQGVSVLTNLYDAKQLSIVLKNAGIQGFATLDGVNILAEIKASDKAPFTPDELDFIEFWRGQYSVFTEPEQVIKLAPWVVR